MGRVHKRTGATALTAWAREHAKSQLAFTLDDMVSDKICTVNYLLEVVVAQGLL